MPPIPHTELGKKILARLHPEEDRGSELDITGMNHWIGIGDDLREVRAKIRELKSEETALAVQFQVKMKETSRVSTEARPWSATWRKSKDSTTTDQAAVIAELAKLGGVSPAALAVVVARHTTAKEGKRSFRFNVGKNTDTEE